MKHPPITSLRNFVVKVSLTVAERRSDERAKAEMARAANRLACPHPLLHAHGQAGKPYQTSRKARGITRNIFNAEGQKSTAGSQK
jgi:hypothetical protein